MGIPTVVLTRQEFIGVVKNAVSGIGLAPDIAMVTFPTENFLPSADLSAVEARKSEFYAGLTTWVSNKVRAVAGRMLSVEAPTYEEALNKANDLMISRQWGDGLPLWPATTERVNWIMRGAPLPRAHVLGKFPPRGAIVTVESCAIALAMAGGRAEYLPVLIAAVEAFFEPSAMSELLQATSGSPFPVVIVSGPMAKKIRLNSGFGLLGPDPEHPAGASIGRALRLMQQNLGGALPATGTMAVFGQMRYTNAVFAEDEEGMPEGWPTFTQERHGFARGVNCISLAFANGAENIFRRGAKKETKEEDVLQGLHRVAQYLRVPNIHYIYGYAEGTPGIVVLSKVVAADLASLGWTKNSIREFLFEHSKIPLADMRAAGGLAWMEIASTEVARESMQLDPWPIAAQPSNIGLVVAGGGHSSHALWLQGYCPGIIGREIKLPPAFDQLVAEADAARAAGSS
ncbi:MAG: hypothetical protein WCK07_14815 [Betaproteobacteria bacterium]